MVLHLFGIHKTKLFVKCFYVSHFLGHISQTLVSLGSTDLASDTYKNIATEMNRFFNIVIGTSEESNPFNLARNDSPDYYRNFPFVH